LALFVSAASALLAIVVTNAQPPTAAPTLLGCTAFHALCAFNIYKGGKSSVLRPALDFMTKLPEPAGEIFAFIKCDTLLNLHVWLAGIAFVGVLSAHYARYGQLPGGIAKSKTA
jgi:hypothetical protein